MSLPQIKGSLVTNQVENHIALAGFHIDFSLIKVQPPSEYQDIGQSLSARRRNDADEGQSHLTAAQLGILFGGIVPDVSNLISAYGLRCSEIANSPTFNPKGTARHGLFANEVGADGTAVWAAATSGAPAIAVHLLGCMLSRMWDPPEAISIWMQFITERRQILASSGNPVELELSKRISLSREQIANWHTSIQAWQRTADEANSRRQNQLLLILNNLGLAVNTKLSLSDSVIDAWITAMVTVDKLISGRPQSVQTGAPLLGLSSWHIYPDMIIFGTGRNSRPTTVTQDDPHVARTGVLTLGIQDLRRSGEGIHWSLPLAFLRYYGQPVHSEARLSARTSRATFEDLIYVALGSLIRRWVSRPDDIDSAARLLVEVQRYVDTPENAGPKRSWTALLASASRAFLTASADSKQSKLQHIKCGRRRYPLFIDNPTADPIFGLSTPSTLLRLIPESANRVKVLRHISQDFGDQRTLMVVQSRCDHTSSAYELTSVEQLPYEGIAMPPALPRKDKLPTKGYLRWLHHSQKELDLLPATRLELSEEISTTSLYLDQIIPFITTPDGYQWQNPPREFFEPILRATCQVTDWMDARGVTVVFTRIFGDPDIAALYSIKIHYWTALTPNLEPKAVGSALYRSLPNIFIIPHVLWVFEQQLFGRDQLYSHFCDGSLSPRLLGALKALQTASSIYEDLHNATIDLRVAEQPLFHHQWISQNSPPSHQPLVGYEVSRNHIFACIARFESGFFNFHPSAMDGVLAISSGNSIYVATCLLQDPCTRASTSAVERVAGNLGKTGMSLLVSPAVPQVREISEDIHLVNHFPFNGKEEDCFAETSLHLSFTEWQLPIDVGSRGNRDVEASYVEAAIGLYDRGKWVADLNILDVFNPRVSRIIPECIQHRSGPKIPLDEISEFVAIDSWEELLDSPTEVGVVRARGNWQGRLAAAALAIQRGHETRIVPEKTCWQCCLALKRRPDLKMKAHEDPLMTDDLQDAIGHVEFVSDDEGSDSETEEVIAKLRTKNGQDGQGAKDGGHAYSGPAVNRNIVYIL